MRSLWKGAISFGLVNIPISLYAATERKDIKFTYLHEACKTPVKYVKFCPNCSREVSMEEIVRGYEYDRGQFVVMREEDFEALPLPTTKSIEIIDFVSLAEIDPIYFDKTYFLEPTQGGLKAYALLRRAMAESGRIALAKVAIRAKESLAAVRVYDGQALTMETMFYPDEIRSYTGLAGVMAPEPRVAEQELAMAGMLIANLSTPFEPAKYQSDYRQALRELIRARIEGEEVVRPAAPEPEQVADLMEALRASLAMVERQAADGPVHLQ